MSTVRMFRNIVSRERWGLLAATSVALAAWLAPSLPALWLSWG